MWRYVPGEEATDRNPLLNRCAHLKTTKHLKPSLLEDAGSQAVQEGCLAHEDETDMLSRNVGNRLTTYSGRYPRIERSSPTPKQKPQISNNKILYTEICVSAPSCDVPHCSSYIAYKKLNIVTSKWQTYSSIRIYKDTTVVIQLYYQVYIIYIYTEWPKKMYTLFTHQYLWNKFKWNFYFRVRV